MGKRGWNNRQQLLLAPPPLLGKKARILINRAEIFKPICRDSWGIEHFVRLEDFMTGMNANVFRENLLVTAAVQ